MPAAVYIAAFHLLRSTSVLHNSDRKILCVKKSALQSLRTIFAKSLRAAPHNGARRFGQCFDPSESMENAGILDVFPIFHTARLGQKIRRSPLSSLCGVALTQNIRTGRTDRQVIDSASCFSLCGDYMDTCLF